MKALLDTNIIIHREANKIVNESIGQLFYWLDQLNYEKCIHPVTIAELNSHQNKAGLKTINVKIDSYTHLKHCAPLGDAIRKLSRDIDTNENDLCDTQLLNEILENRVAILISEDKKIHRKALILGINKRVFRIQDFLEWAVAENPGLVTHSVLAVKKTDFAEVDVKDPFFDSFRIDYQEFNDWFNKKAEDPCYVCYSNNQLIAFLFVKIENSNEAYPDIMPAFLPKKRLKIGTLKVIGNGYKIGERFLKTIFDNAIRYKVDEIYVTVFNKRPEQEQLIDMLKDWGFCKHGIKTTSNGEELVYIRPFHKKLPVNTIKPRQSFPFFSWTTNKYLIKIEPQYHTELFPDSINTREDKTRYMENEPHRNRICKAYISHAPDRTLKTGDVIIVYRIGDTIPKKYSSTVTSICIVENIKTEFKDFEEFYDNCKRRTMLGKEDLRDNWWNKFPNRKPFIINCLYAHSFPTPKPTLNDLVNLGVFSDALSVPQGIVRLSDDQFNLIVKFAYRKN